MRNPWFRLYAEFASDPVVQSLAFDDQRHYIVVLCLKCSGVLDRRIDPRARNRIIVQALGLDSDAADACKRNLMEVGLIAQNWQPKAWKLRQYKSDDVTVRVRKYRKNKETGNVSETDQNRTETEQKQKEKISPPNPPSSSASAIFETWWSVYPKKVGKKTARAIWSKRHLDDLADTLIADVRERASNDRGWLAGFVPNPTTYLNGDRWEDEIDRTPTRRNGNGNGYETPYDRVVRLNGGDDPPRADPGPADAGDGETLDADEWDLRR